MNDLKTINDAEFDQKVSLREAYQIMELYVHDYLERGDTSIADFRWDIALTSGGNSTDPAALNDFLDATQKILKQGK